jgi:hypothetical protein
VTVERREAARLLHRKNAAEWLLWALLLPLVPVAWWIERSRSKRN